MRPVNLIPPEERRGERAPLRSGPLAYVIVGALLLAFIGVYLMVSADNSISESEASVASLEQELDSAEARAQALQSFTSFSSLEQARTLTVSSLARSRFDWERVLRELALVVPPDLTLTALCGAVSSEASAGGSGGADCEVGAIADSVLGPRLSITGCAPTQETVARMLAALRDIDGVTRVGLASSADSLAGGGSAGGATGPTACSPKTPTAFALTVAFDEVAVPVDGAAIAPLAPTTGGQNDGGVAEAQEAQRAGRDAVESAEEKSRNAVDRFVPGT